MPKESENLVISVSSSGGVGKGAIVVIPFGVHFKKERILLVEKVARASRDEGCGPVPEISRCSKIKFGEISAKPPVSAS